jgi:REP element-mobilizing transposase RayT
MPNHVHGIVIINKPDGMVKTQNMVETQNIASLQPGNPQNPFGPQSQNLASIVRGYKIGVTKFARQNGIPFLWQTRYHDHIIRNEREYETICRYIYENPQRWLKDKFYTSEI